MGGPSFSIIVPTYQRRDAVRETVKALGKLDYDGEVEVIVSVDGSTDGTAEALSSLSSPFPVRLVVGPNRGLSSARNRGAAEAGGDVLLFLDDDMTCNPDLLAEHARSYAEGADAVVGQFIEPGVAAPASMSNEVVGPFGLFAGQFSVRRSAFARVGGFDESFTADGGYGYEDTEFVHRLLRGFAVRRNPRAISYHRVGLHPLRLVERARRCANAEQLLLAKHPELAEELNAWTGASRISKRLRLLAAVPFAPRILATIAAAVAEVGMRTSLISNRGVTALCDRAYTLAYWSGVERTRGIPR